MCTKSNSPLPTYHLTPLIREAALVARVNYAGALFLPLCHLRTDVCMQTDEECRTLKGFTLRLFAEPMGRRRTPITIASSYAGKTVSHEQFARLIAGCTRVTSIVIKSVEESRSPSRRGRGHERCANTHEKGEQHWVIMLWRNSQERVLSGAYGGWGLPKSEIQCMCSIPTSNLKLFSRSARFLWINTLVNRSNAYLRSMPLNIVMVQFNPQVRCN